MTTAPSQQEADDLLRMEKYYRESAVIKLPAPGEQRNIVFESADGREEFLLDLSRSRIKLSKRTFQNRARVTVILARLDLDGAPHRNPNGDEIPCPHLHIYKEGAGDKWAIRLPDNFANLNTPADLLDEFMNYCTIVTKPKIQQFVF